MKFKWWQQDVIYQIYPRSFQDTNGDGIGDLQGIRRRLDYLEWLGIDAIWISPFYPSPMADFGYDVADYTGIHPMFGDMGDFDQLFADAHARGIRIILDLVPNHSSDQHPWFVEARQSRSNGKRDWYLWADPAPDGGPPNNWLSVFGGSAWEWDAHTGQYYYHAFLKEQPDLNWRNPDVRNAILDVMRFWFDKGVDGFRVDVMWHIVKDAELRDNPPNPHYRPGEEPPYHAVLPVYSTDQAEVHDYVRIMRQLTDSYGDRVIIGEVYLPIADLMRYYGEDNSGAHLPFNFQLITLPWDAAEIYAAITAYEAALPADGWPNWVLGNHDQRRIASRIGHAQARVAVVLLLTLRGTPTLYYGDEIGMTDVPIAPEDYQDPQGINIGVSRDPARTPMQWDASKNAGFTDGKPWLPVGTDYKNCNVEIERREADSMLALHRALIRLRREHDALRVGSFIPLASDPHGFAFARQYGNSCLLIALNLSAQPISLLSNRALSKGTIVLSTNGDRTDALSTESIDLRANEAIVVLLDEPIS